MKAGLAAVLVAAVLAAAGWPVPAARGAPPRRDPVVLIAAGRRVRWSELQAAIGQVPDPPERVGLEREPLRAARWYGRLVALAQAARRLGLESPALARQHAYYRRHPGLFRQIRARCILISDRAALAPRSRRSRRAARRMARSIALALRRGERFAAAARRYSDDAATRSRGGELGFVGPGQTTPGFWRHLEALRRGQISPPFATRFGWNIAQAEAAREAPFATVQGLIAGRLRQQALDRRVAAVLAAAHIRVESAALERAGR
jgi:hypothetical protein